MVYEKWALNPERGRAAVCWVEGDPDAADETLGYVYYPDNDPQTGGDGDAAIDFDVQTSTWKIENYGGFDLLTFTGGEADYALVERMVDAFFNGRR